MDSPSEELSYASELLKKFRSVRGKGFDYYLSIILLCIINLYVENIKNVITKCFLIKIFLRNSAKSEKKRIQS